jgi:hypothetical protein
MDAWPELAYVQWSDTLQTLHRWTQIVGKIRLRLEPLVNHWWNVALYVTPHGLTTSSMPYRDGRSFSIDLDFLQHELRIARSDGQRAGFALEPMTVAAFYEKLMRELHGCGFEVHIDKRPNELADAAPFDRDTEHHAYDAAAVERFGRVLLQADRLCKQFRAGFLGKASPVHFFWGSFDLAVSRFSGRTAPPHPGGIPNLPDWVTREAYSREEHSAGFWPGGPGADALFYAYAYPEPPGYAQAAVKPPAAQWNDGLREFTLPYAAVRSAPDPDRAVLDFFESTYAAAADLAKWDRPLLERASAS